MKRLVAFFLFSLLFPAVLHAASPALNDFAYGIPLTPDPANSVNRVKIPEEVYKGVTRANLADVRVFNGDGETVPHAVDRSMPQEIFSPLPPVALPLFPLEGEIDVPKYDFSFAVEVEGADGRIARIKTNPATVNNDAVRCYVLDATSLPQMTNGLIFAWPETTPVFLKDITIESSDDLSVWRHVTRATLADLKYGTDLVRKNAASFAPLKAKYFRVTWDGGAFPTQITSVSAVPESRPLAPPLRWSEAIAISPSLEMEKGSVVFDAGGFLPTERVKIALPSAGMLFHAELASSDSPLGPWTRRASGRIFRLLNDGKEIIDSGFDAISTDRYWKLSVAGEIGLSAPPLLRLGYRPQELLFVAQGKPPFLIAYGNATAMAADFGMANLHSNFIDTDLKIPDAEVGEQTVLGGEAKLSPPVPPPPYKKWFLWGLIGGGVAVLALMSRSLLKEMK